MRIIGLLSWYDEPVGWLQECVTSAARLCDHLIAVDGPYVRFPGAAERPASPCDQAEVIAHAAAAAGIGCAVHAPGRPWPSEVAKRDFMFRLGMLSAEEGADWFLRIDADELLTGVPADTRAALATTGFDVAEVSMWPSEHPGFRHPIRVLFRALPGIGVQQAHYLVTAPGGHGTRVLCGSATAHRMEPAVSLPDVRLDHRSKERTSLRRRAKEQYYARLPDIEKLKELT